MKPSQYTDAECLEAVVGLEQYVGREACLMLCEMAITCGSTEEAMRYLPPLGKWSAEQQAGASGILSKAIEGYRRKNRCVPGHSLN